ncbi:MAG: rhamnulokinase [Paramuribaculum sp.]|nr:rhamnulokinase [Paramuribaculum sp.]
MSARDAYIAADFGGGSGRVMAGTADADGNIELNQIHRFANRQVKLGRHVYWDLPSLFAEMIEGLRMAVAEGYHIRSIGIDSWGVDFGLLDREGELLQLPVCYRDEVSTTGAAEEYFAARSKPDHYAEAGIQIMDINSLYRLARLAKRSELMDAAGAVLFFPDLMSYFLTGNINVEYTIATTSELIDARTRDWNYRVIDSAGLPRRLFGPIVEPGTIRGWLTEEIRRHIGVDYEIPVVAVASHDTASAAAVCPSFDEGATAFLSSGTWSLLGVTIDEPILTEQARMEGFTNEGATDHRITFLQNITGLWILQNLVADWEHAGIPADYPTLIAQAEASTYKDTVDVDSPRLARSGINMEAEIRRLLSEQGAPAPDGEGDIVRCVLLSLARRYARAIKGLDAILPRPVERLRIIGGGSKNNLLNKLTAQSTGLNVEAGPAEATALGNIKMQIQALKP